MNETQPEVEQNLSSDLLIKFAQDTYIFGNTERYGYQDVTFCICVVHLFDFIWRVSEKTVVFVLIILRFSNWRRLKIGDPATDEDWTISCRTIGKDWRLGVLQLSTIAQTIRGSTNGEYWKIRDHIAVDYWKIRDSANGEDWTIRGLIQAKLGILGVLQLAQIGRWVFIQVAKIGIFEVVLLANIKRSYVLRLSNFGRRSVLKLTIGKYVSCIWWRLEDKESSTRYRLKHYGSCNWPR